MKAARHLVTGIGAFAALGASALAVAWLIRSSAHPDRPPLFAVAAFLFAIAAGSLGVVLFTRTAMGLLRASRELRK